MTHIFFLWLNHKLIYITINTRNETQHNGASKDSKKHSEHHKSHSSSSEKSNKNKRPHEPDHLSNTPKKHKSSSTSTQSEEKKSTKSTFKHVNDGIEIDHSMGMGFADALGMCTANARKLIYLKTEII